MKAVHRVLTLQLNGHSYYCPLVLGCASSLAATNGIFPNTAPKRRGWLAVEHLNLTSNRPESLAEFFPVLTLKSTRMYTLVIVCYCRPSSSVPCLPTEVTTAQGGRGRVACMRTWASFAHEDLWPLRACWDNPGGPAAYRMGRQEHLWSQHGGSNPRLSCGLPNKVPIIPSRTRAIINLFCAALCCLHGSTKDNYS